MSYKFRILGYHTIGCLIKILLVFLAVVLILVFLAIPIADQLYSPDAVSEDKVYTASVYLTVGEFGIGNVLGICPVVSPDNCWSVFRPGIERFVRWSPDGPIVSISGEEYLFNLSTGDFYRYTSR